MGGLEYRKSLQDQLGVASSTAEQQLRHREVPSGMRSCFEKISEKLAREIQKVLSQSETALRAPEVATVRICGGGSLIPGLPGFLSQWLELPILPMDPLQKLETEHLSAQEVDLSCCRARYAVAIGLALRMAREE
jgi:Tfp pilus assembly PilM family ATPase